MAVKRAAGHLGIWAFREEARQGISCRVPKWQGAKRAKRPHHYYHGYDRRNTSCSRYLGNRTDTDPRCARCMVLVQTVTDCSHCTNTDLEGSGVFSPPPNHPIK